MPVVADAGEEEGEGEGEDEEGRENGVCFEEHVALLRFCD
jgi:hypothetical protein